MGFYAPAQIVRDAGARSGAFGTWRLSGKCLPEGIASAAAVASAIQRLPNSIVLAGDANAGVPRAKYLIDNA
jgi:hypothetical protein